MAENVILIRSSWQTANIGDIAHTPGLLALLRRHLPEARLALWPGRLDRGVDGMLRRHFPDVEILGPQDPGAIDAAIDRADDARRAGGSGAWRFVRRIGRLRSGGCRPDRRTPARVGLRAGQRSPGNRRCLNGAEPTVAGPIRTAAADTRRAAGTPDTGLRIPPRSCRWHWAAGTP